MMDYDALLERAEKILPQQTAATERFKLPAPRVEINGNRTFIKNLKEVAERCERKPEHLLKYLARELATSGLLEGHQAVYTGKFNQNLIRSKVSEYVKEFVRCPECKKPDTKLLKENRQLMMKCMACGARHPVRSL